MNRDGEIVGLKASNHSRSCESHSCFGEHISTHDLIQFRYCVLDVYEAPEDAVKACRIRDGTESCVIGFLPRHVVVSNKERYIGKFAQIVELCEESDNKTKRLKNRRNLGIAAFSLLDNIVLC